MDRRDTIKSLLLGSVAAGIAFQGCAPDTKEATKEIADLPFYGRTPEEKEHDQKIFASEFLNEHELGTIAVLCDIILPASDAYGSANDAKVPEFIDFIVKDLPSHQTPLRGGLMWLDNFSNKSYGKEFIACTNEEQLVICDQIAYPLEVKPELKQGAEFFTRMRNLTLTGYYTTKMGLEDLGYKGNTPNVWDGVPEEILKEHQLSYDAEWLAKCVNQDTRADIAKWDDQGNLIS
ncbi:MAG: gluconate 2-dehydrogenase subunit 3 family protein [Flavobacteriaceae bacterium]|nr:gluconate 2-dehydrogenase subunit 3 family protein [Flavobacteriaceae bacterium]